MLLIGTSMRCPKVGSTALLRTAAVLGWSPMRTLHVGLRVSDLERSLAFYTTVGYTVIGTVEGTAHGSLTMLQLPGDDFVTIELVYDPAKGEAGPGAGINHLVIQVESLDATRVDLAARGIEPE